MKLRRAELADAPAIARLHRAAVRENLPFLPELHTAEEDLAFFRDVFLAEETVWVAEADDGRVAGYVGFHDGWVRHLFVHPDHQRRGLGPQLLAIAMADGGPKQLWTFAANTRARRFYEARGWRAVEFGDGSGNEEGHPDVRYAWAPPAS